MSPRNPDEPSLVPRMWLGNEASMGYNKIVFHFSDHYASLAHESDELAKQQTECQRHFQRAMETAEDDNTKVMMYTNGR